MTVSITSCVKKRSANPIQDLPKERKDEAIAAYTARMNEVVENDWDAIEASLREIDGLFAPEKTDEDWTRIQAEAERIVNAKIADVMNAEMFPDGKEDLVLAVNAAAGITEGNYIPPFSFTNNKWTRVRSAVGRIIASEQSGVTDRWEYVRRGMEEYLDDQAGRLDERNFVSVPPSYLALPTRLAWENYDAALQTGRSSGATLGRFFLNSFVVAAAAIVITLLSAFMATYALTRLVWKGRKLMNKFFMLGLTIPIHAAIVPVFVIMSRLKLTNTYFALILPYAAFSLSMAILISIGFMGDIPYDLDEAAFLDGCGVWGIFFRVILPLMMPAVSTVGIYTFLQCWNELLFANIFVSSGVYRTLPVGISQLFGEHTTSWGPIGAALSIATIPTLVVYIALSKKIQAGFIAGAVKG